MAAAKAADQGNPQDGQALYGVPVTVKECFDVLGTASTAGLVGWASKLQTDDAELVRRLRGAGAIVTAKTNVSQRLLYAESDNPLYGRTNNPWDLARTPGGSSGGEAALVAAFGSPLGLGTDFGGSIRVPAHFSGVCGLRATPGRLSMAGTADQVLFGNVPTLPDSAGPIARTVADVKLAMDGLGTPVPRATGQRRFSHLVRNTGMRTQEETQALVARRDAYRKRFETAVAGAGIDVLVCPPNALPALTHGASADLGPASFNYTMLYNVLAWPAGVVPVSRVRPVETDRRPQAVDMVDRAARRVDKDSAGLPVGVQVAARPGREDLIVAVMSAVE